MWPLDARHVAEWLDRYNRARSSYVFGAISGNEAVEALKKLRYRDEALRLEMTEWMLAKRKRGQQMQGKALKMLEPYLGQIQERIDPAQEPPPSEKESVP